MARACQCDRCKKCFVPDEINGFMLRFLNPSTYTKKQFSRGLRGSLYSNKGVDEYIDLCPLCTEKFVKFMNVNITKEDS